MGSCHQNPWCTGGPGFPTPLSPWLDSGHRLGSGPLGEGLVESPLSSFQPRTRKSPGASLKLSLSLASSLPSPSPLTSAPFVVLSDWLSRARRAPHWFFSLACIPAPALVSISQQKAQP